MKRVIAVILTVLLMTAVCLTLTGCDAPKVRVESVMKLNDQFAGSRTVTVVYPLSADIDAIKDDILADSPVKKDTEGVSFEYLGATENGYSFELKVKFDNRADYESQIAAIIGRDAHSVLAHQNTVMFKGTHMAEDFDVSDLVGWIARDTAADDATKDYTFEYTYNKVTIGDDTYDTASTVKINKGKGVPVSAVDIKTFNDKASLFERTFDRSFVFTIPADSYTDNKRKISAYFEKLAGDAAQITDTREGNSVLYTIAYKGLSLDELESATASVLDSDGTGIYYGDKGNVSTPLFDGRMLEETVDTLSFCNQKGKAPQMRYTYSLPTDAVHGEGAIYLSGSWENTGTWEDGAFRLTGTTGLTRLRIFDGRQYYIDGVEVELTALGGEKFRRTTSFLYPVKDGFEGPVFATKFFESKKAKTKTDTVDDHIVCSVICEGKTDAINTSLESIFGKGNHISYSRKSGALSDKTTFTDNIDLREMLSLANAKAGLTYITSAENGENIVTLTNGGAETAYEGKEKSKIEMEQSLATIGYHGVIPKAGNILLYIIFGAALFVLTTLIAYRMLVPPIKRERAGRSRAKEYEEPIGQMIPDQTEEPSNAPMQTTTFSIFELGFLSRNKKYVDEINNDVENRLKANRIQKRKNELRRKELEEMEKKVYGEPEPEEAPAVQEPAPKPAAPRADDSPRTQELLDALEEASKNEPALPEPTDPNELLSLMHEEDGNDSTDSV